MTIFEKQIRMKIAKELNTDNNEKIIVADYNDIDYPVYYEIKLERIN